jgi:hypothetical protein
MVVPKEKKDLQKELQKILLAEQWGSTEANRDVIVSYMLRNSAKLVKVQHRIYV